MSFTKYMHLERLGNLEVQGITEGTVHIFPKLDGANASVWKTETGFGYGSRNRELSLDNDNAGFMAVMESDQGKYVRKYLEDHPNHILYGEWLVPHTIKNYEKLAFRHFYVFDVFDKETEQFIPYENYYLRLGSYNVIYIPSIATLTNPDTEALTQIAKDCRFLLGQDATHGEGIVLKRYDFQNKHGRTTWAKLVLNEFKDVKGEEPKPYSIEEQWAKDLVTEVLVEKEFAKLALDGWASAKIPRLLETVWRCVITEELYDYLHKKKEATKDNINFRELRRQVNTTIREIKKELF